MAWQSACSLKWQLDTQEPKHRSVKAPTLQLEKFTNAWYNTYIIKEVSVSWTYSGLSREFQGQPKGFPCFDNKI